MTSIKRKVLNAAVAQLAGKLGAQPQIRVQRVVRSPRHRVANHLLNAGFKLCEDDIRFTHGGIYKRLDDIIECWRVLCLDQNDKEVWIVSGSTLTACAAGIEITPNTESSELYGDFIAEPKKRTPNEKS
jgi:hypothetical protein